MRNLSSISGKVKSSILGSILGLMDPRILS
jgi:hypothetical protein